MFFFAFPSYWQFSVTSVPNHQLTVWIDGQSVALHDQFIRCDVHAIFWYEFNSFDLLVNENFSLPRSSV